jgi:hypothetical protein
MMLEKSHELVRLNQRIADIQRCIEEAHGQDGQPWVTSERARILALLNTTLKALEERKATLEQDLR